MPAQLALANEWSVRFQMETYFCHLIWVFMMSFARCPRLPYRGPGKPSLINEAEEMPSEKLRLLGNSAH